MIRELVGDWRLVAVRGVAAVLFGLATLIWPDVTLWVLVLLWGAFVLVDGVFSVVAAVSGRRVVAHRGWLVFSGLVGIAAGIVTFVWPSITALVLLYVIAFWAIVIGALMIATAVRLRAAIRHEWALAVAVWCPCCSAWSCLSRRERVHSPSPGRSAGACWCPGSCC